MTKPPAFDTSQSSMLFINCCFALSLSGIIPVLDGALNGELYELLWLPLPVYLTFVVWRQYSIYYMPVQYYRRVPESATEELSTLAITISLGCIGLFAAHFPRLSVLPLAFIIFLNMWKLAQMRAALDSAPHVSVVARNEIARFRVRLLSYLGLLGCFTVFMEVYQRFMWPALFVLLSSAIPIALLEITPRVLSEIFSRIPVGDGSPTPEEYITAVASAWCGDGVAEHAD